MCFYFIYFGLMMLLFLNIVIAILMDGYATVKELANSKVEEQIKFNVGPLLPTFLSAWKRRLLFWRPKHPDSCPEPWSDERWAALVIQRLVRWRRRAARKRAMRRHSSMF